MIKCLAGTLSRVVLTPAPALLLPQRVTCDCLFKLFGTCGDVMRVKILFHKRNMALIEFRDSSHAYARVRGLWALACVRRHGLRGRGVGVCLCARDVGGCPSVKAVTVCLVRRSWALRCVWGNPQPLFYVNREKKAGPGHCVDGV